MNHKNLPHNTDLERAILGSCLLNFEQDHFTELDNFLNEESFYEGRHQTIYKAMKNLVNKGFSIDLFTLQNELDNNGELKTIGGLTYLTRLTDEGTSWIYVLQYASLMVEYATRRAIIKKVGQVDGLARDKSISFTEITETAERTLFEIGQSGHHFTSYKGSQELISLTLEKLEERKNRKNQYSGIPSKFTELDELTSGFQNSEVTIIGARPSIGKTALALTMFHNIAVSQNIAAGFFSLEMPETALIERLLIGDAKVDGRRLRNPSFLSSSDWQNITTASKKIYGSKIFIDDTPNMSLAHIKSQARRMKSKEDIKILFIDYIGLISVDDKMERYNQVSLISRHLKELARELDIPVVILAQLGREAESKDGKDVTPTLAHLRDSGSIEQDADVVLFLHRKRELEEDATGIETKLIIAKNRNGPVDTVKIVFIPRFARFENLSANSPK